MWCVFSGSGACLLPTCVSVYVVCMLLSSFCSVQIAAVVAAFFVSSREWQCLGFAVFPYAVLCWAVGFWGGVMGMNFGVSS